MAKSKDFKEEDIKSRFGISCPVGLSIECDKEITDEIAEKAIRNYCEFHLASEEKIAAADAFWQKFHTYVTDAKKDQKNSEEYREWEKALERLNQCKNDFIEMKHSLGLGIHHIVKAKAA